MIYLIVYPFTGGILATSRTVRGGTYRTRCNVPDGSACERRPVLATRTPPRGLTFQDNVNLDDLERHTLINSVNYFEYRDSGRGSPTDESRQGEEDSYFNEGGDRKPRPGESHTNTNTFTSGPGAGSDQYKFQGGLLVPDGRVVFVPLNSATIGLYDPSPSTARRKPAYTLSQTLPPLWNVALLPYYNKL